VVETWDWNRLITTEGSQNGGKNPSKRAILLGKKPFLLLTERTSKSKTVGGTPGKVLYRRLKVFGGYEGNLSKIDGKRNSKSLMRVLIATNRKRSFRVSTTEICCPSTREKI